MRGETQEEAKSESYNHPAFAADETPSHTDMYITAPGLARTRLVDLEPNILVSCSKAGWQCFEFLKDNEGRDVARERFDRRFMLDVEGLVIHDSMIANI